MDVLFEISTWGRYLVTFQRLQDSRNRHFYSAEIKLSPNESIILDDRNLPRLRQRLKEVMLVRRGALS